MPNSNLFNMQVQNIRPILLLIALAQLAGCQCNKNSKKVDLSGIEADVKIAHFEQDLFSLDTTNLSSQLGMLQQKHPLFLPFYIEQMMGFGRLGDTTTPVEENLSAFISNQYTREVADTCALIFDDMSQTEKELEKAFRYYQYYFPDRAYPSVVTFTGNFAYASLTVDTTLLAIGLDMYLGSNYKYYTSLFPVYLRQQLDPAYMVPNCVKVLATMHQDVILGDNTLLSRMVAEGAKLYFSDLLLPDTPDHLKIGYQEEDIQWCMQNEWMIWNFFIDRELLYTTNVGDVDRFFTPGPSTSGMPVESPPLIGAWVGWQIVRKFMKQNPEITYQELLNKYDAQTILNRSKYKPVR